MGGKIRGGKLLTDRGENGQQGNKWGDGVAPCQHRFNGSCGLLQFHVGMQIFNL